MAGVPPSRRSFLALSSGRDAASDSWTLQVTTAATDVHDTALPRSPPPASPTPRCGSSTSRALRQVRPHSPPYRPRLPDAADPRCVGGT